MKYTPATLAKLLESEQIIKGAKKTAVFTKEIRNRFYANLKKYGYQIDDDNMIAVEKLAVALFEGRKGAFAYGTTGTGKSLLMKIISGEYEIEFLSAVEISRHYASVKENEFWEWFSQFKRGNLIIDDLLADREKSTYGQVSIIPEVIAERETIYRERGERTFFTSNCKAASEISDRYGDRLKSRIFGMCEPVMFVGRDRRAEG